MTAVPPTRLTIGVAEPTPLGPLWIAVTYNGLVAVEFDATEAEFRQILEKRFGKACPIDCPTPGAPEANQVDEAVSQVRDYLKGVRPVFDLPIDWSHLRPFQRAVLEATYAVPYGQVTTYAEIARLVGKPRAARAVGRAEATNPMPLVIPCHRVLGTDGALHGYGGPGGIPTKAWLLKMEGVRLA